MAAFQKKKYGKGHVLMLRFRIFAIYMICQRIRHKVLARIIADIAKHCQKLYAINKTGIQTKGNVSTFTCSRPSVGEGRKLALGKRHYNYSVLYNRPCLKYTFPLPHRHDGLFIKLRLQ